MDSTGRTSGSGALGGRVKVAAQMKGKGEKKKKKSLKAQVNYCCAYSVPFMWGEGLVRLLGVGGL